MEVICLDDDEDDNVDGNKKDNVCVEKDNDQVPQSETMCIGNASKLVIPFSNINVNQSATQTLLDQPNQLYITRKKDCLTAVSENISINSQQYGTINQSDAYGNTIERIDRSSVMCIQATEIYSSSRAVDINDKNEKDSFNNTTNPALNFLVTEKGQNLTPQILQNSVAINVQNTDTSLPNPISIDVPIPSNVTNIDNCLQSSSSVGPENAKGLLISNSLKKSQLLIPSPTHVPLKRPPWLAPVTIPVLKPQFMPQTVNKIMHPIVSWGTPRSPAIVAMQTANNNPPILTGQTPNNIPRIVTVQTSKINSPIDSIRTCNNNPPIFTMQTSSNKRPMVAIKPSNSNPPVVGIRTSNNNPRCVTVQTSNNHPIVTMQTSNINPSMCTMPTPGINHPIVTMQTSNINHSIVTMQPSNSNSPILTMQASNATHPIITLQPSNQSTPVFSVKTNTSHRPPDYSSAVLNQKDVPSFLISPPVVNAGNMCSMESVANTYCLHTIPGTNNTVHVQNPTSNPILESLLLKPLEPFRLDTPAKVLPISTSSNNPSLPSEQPLVYRKIDTDSLKVVRTLGVPTGSTFRHRQSANNTVGKPYDSTKKNVSIVTPELTNSESPNLASKSASSNFNKNNSQIDINTNGYVSINNVGAKPRAILPKSDNSNKIANDKVENKNYISWDDFLTKHIRSYLSINAKPPFDLQKRLAIELEKELPAKRSQKATSILPKPQTISKRVTTELTKKTVEEKLMKNEPAPLLNMTTEQCDEIILINDSSDDEKDIKLSGPTMERNVSVLRSSHNYNSSNAIEENKNSSGSERNQPKTKNRNGYNRSSSIMFDITSESDHKFSPQDGSVDALINNTESILSEGENGPLHKEIISNTKFPNRDDEECKSMTNNSNEANVLLEPYQSIFTDDVSISSLKVRGGASSSTSEVSPGKEADLIANHNLSYSHWNSSDFVIKEEFNSNQFFKCGPPAQEDEENKIRDKTTEDTLKYLKDILTMGEPDIQNAENSTEKLSTEPDEILTDDIELNGHRNEGENILKHAQEMHSEYLCNSTYSLKDEANTGPLLNLSQSTDKQLSNFPNTSICSEEFYIKDDMEILCMADQNVSGHGESSNINSISGSSPLKSISPPEIVNSHETIDFDKSDLKINSNFSNIKNLDTIDVSKCKDNIKMECDFVDTQLVNVNGGKFKSYKTDDSDSSDSLQDAYSEADHYIKVDCHTDGFTELKPDNVLSEVPVNDKPFVCPHCGFGVAIQRNLEMHIKAFHSAGSSPKKNKKTNLNKKKTAKEKTRLHRCSQCIFQTYNSLKITRHMKIEHSIFSCYKCSFIVDNEEDLKHHERIHKSVKCSLCDILILLSKYEDHLANAHPTTHRFKCDHCDFGTNAEWKLRNHKKSSCNGTDNTNTTTNNTVRCAYICYACGFRASSELTLASHQKLNHFQPGHSYICKFCTFSSTNKKDMTKHKYEAHQIEYSFACNLCLFKTNKQKPLNNHMEKQHGIEDTNGDETSDCDTSDEDIIQCKHCEFETNSEIVIKEHCQKHHKGKCFLCNHCTESTVNEQCLTTKESEKTDITYQCQYCSFVSDKLGSLNEHKYKVHTNELPFSCRKCIYRSRCSQHLERHERCKHNFCRKRYDLHKCKYCNFKTSEISQLTKHRYKVHCTKSIYECNLCVYQSSRLYDLKKHCKNVHKNKISVFTNKSLCTKSDGRVIPPRRIIDAANEQESDLYFYYCQSCDYKTRETSNLDKHWLSVHDKCVNCPHCPTIWNSINSLYDHKYKDHADYYKHKCSFCLYCSSGRGSVVGHEKAVHKAINCYYCDVTIYSINSLNEHIHSSHPKKLPFYCNMCGYQTLKEDFLKKHNLKLHPTLKCNDCNFTSETLKLSLKHICEVHPDKMPFSCKKCSFRSFNEEGLNNHLLSCHINKCSLCRFKAPSSNELGKHKFDLHQKEYFSFCVICSYQASPQTDISIHEMMVHSYRTYRCTMCFFYTDTFSKLKMHISESHGDQNNVLCHLRKCPLCSFATTSSSRFYKHLKQIHSEQYCWNCNKCYFSSTTKARLLAHNKRSHKNCKLFKCSHCSFVIDTYGELKKHLHSTHSKKYPFFCQMCSYRGNSKSLLKKHIIYNHSS